MGHAHSGIHDRHYLNQIVKADIVSAFLEKPSDTALMELIGNMSLSRDPNAPSKPSQGQCEQIRHNSEVLKSKKRLQKATENFRKRYGTMTSARRLAKNTTRDPKHDEAIEAVKLLDKQRRDHDKLYKQKLNKAFEASREGYFATLEVSCLENQHSGQEEAPGPTQPDFLFTERTKLANALFSCSSTATSYTEQIDQSCDIIETYASLCGRREYPRLRIQQGKNSAIEDEVKPCFLDTEPDVYPIRCPGTQYLFCLDNNSLPPNTRTRCFANPYSLTRHVHEQHLRRIPTSMSFTCPHPSCTLDGVLLISHNEFKLHAMRDHYIVHTG